MKRTCEVCHFPPEGDRLYPMHDSRGLLVNACHDCAREIQDAQNREPAEADGEAFRGGEAAAHDREQQDRIQRTLK